MPAHMSAHMSIHMCMHVSVHMSTHMSIAHACTQVLDLASVPLALASGQLFATAAPHCQIIGFVTSLVCLYRHVCTHLCR